jgi:hypothetical protein
MKKKKKKSGKTNFRFSFPTVATFSHGPADSVHSPMRTPIGKGKKETMARYRGREGAGLINLSARLPADQIHPAP